MNRSLLPQALLSWMRRRRGSASAAARPITLHGIGIDADAARRIREQLPALGERLGLSLRLADDHGDLVLVDDAVWRSVSPAVVSSLAEGRPRLVLRRTGPSTAAAPRGVDLDDLAVQLQPLRELLAQREQADPPLSGEAVFQASWPADADETQPGAVDSDFDPGFNSRWPDALVHAPAPSERARAFVEALLPLRTDPSAAPVQAVYPGGGVLILNGATGRAVFDADAWMSLRLHEPLPHLQAGATPHGELADYELDLVLWMLGLAAEELPLLEAPADWWHAPLTPVHLRAIGRYTLKPLHLDMARVLARGGVTPSALRRECRVSERELRRFLQACLFLCLVWWRPARLPDWALPAPADHA